MGDPTASLAQFNVTYCEQLLLAQAHIAAVRRGQLREGDLDAGGARTGCSALLGFVGGGLVRAQVVPGWRWHSRLVLEHERSGRTVLNGSVRIGTPWAVSRSCSAWALSACSEPETLSTAAWRQGLCRAVARGQEQDWVGLERRHARRYSRHGLEAEFVLADPAERCRSWTWRARKAGSDKWGIAITRLSWACGQVVQVGDPVSPDDLGLSSRTTGIDSGRGS
jgi:hypothetical protein